MVFKMTVHVADMVVSSETQSLALFMQPLSHLHNGPQWSPAWCHLQFPLQATKQPQWSNSEHPLLASGRLVQYGAHALGLSFNSQPYSLGFGMVEVLDRDCFQMKAAMSNARFVCWNNACWVGGMDSRGLRPTVNIVDLQFLLYISTVKRSRRCMCNESSVRLVGSWVMAMEVSVTSEMAHTFHAVFLPIPNIADVTSHPVNEWKKRSAWQRWGPSCWEMWWIGISVNGFPDPIQSTALTVLADDSNWWEELPHPCPLSWGRA